MAVTQIIATLIVSVMFGSFFTVAADDQPRSEIRFAIASQFPPYESRDEKGQLVGLNIELGNALCAQLNVRCIWVDQVFADSIPALERRRFDAIMGMASTPQRRQLIDFTDDLYPLTTHLVARKDSGLVPTVRSLRGKRVGVLAASNREAFAHEQWAPGGVIVKSFWINDQLISSLVAGDIDATLQGMIEIREALLDTPNGHDFNFSGPAVMGEQLGKGVAIGVRKLDTALRDDLNRALGQLKQTGEYQRITERYLPKEERVMPVAGVGPQFYPGASGLPFSEVVKVGNILYFSDVLGLDARRNPVHGGAAAQMKQAMHLLREMLERHQSSLAHVVKCTLLLTDLDDLPQVSEVYLSYFPTNRLPARSVISVRRLPRRAMVAIGCIAVSQGRDELPGPMPAN
ncbi:transporter substrate-binding domain-containing protein [Pseudomonas sp. CCM 7891]|uniref:Transporter substrate-binding domain-containing protein n=1 Tax=Pseudomonas karstica TaxID=1055468 RepID=A0A7X2UZM5_9PSED|nr:transporter substrate-binding domain-containing protein [Pseudomonas karstica]MTD20668.1 transporter substrate-binding domain-containing protein [Pseudomonas karstica]